MARDLKDCPLPPDHGALMTLTPCPGPVSSQATQEALAIQAAALKAQEAPNPGAVTVPGNLAAMNDPSALTHTASGPRASALVFEALSRLELRIDGNQAEVWLRGNPPGLLYAVQRPAPAQLQQIAGQLRSQLQEPDFANERRLRAAAIALQDCKRAFEPLEALPGLSLQTKPLTLELLDIAEVISGPVLHALKQALQLPRPQAVIASLPLMLDVPGHAAMPAGHACTAFLKARLLDSLSGSAHSQALYGAAGFIAANRVLAGLHYWTDNLAGAQLGLALADWLLAQPQARAFAFDPTVLEAGLTVQAMQHQTLQALGLESGGAHTLGCSLLPPIAPCALPLWQAMRAAAAHEWT